MRPVKLSILLMFTFSIFLTTASITFSGTGDYWVSCSNTCSPTPGCILAEGGCCTPVQGIDTSRPADGTYDSWCCCTPGPSWSGSSCSLPASQGYYDLTKNPLQCSGYDYVKYSSAAQKRNYGSCDCTVTKDSYITRVCVSGQYILSDSFGDGDYAYNPTWTVNSGTWVVEGADKVLSQDAVGGPHVITTGGSGMVDYKLSAIVTLKNTDRSFNGIVFRYKDSNNYYFLILDPVSSNIILGKKTGATYSPLSTPKPVTIAIDTPYKLEVELRGTNIKAYLDGNLVFNIEDTSYRSGKIGLMADTHVHFDNIAVKEMKCDSTPQNSVTSYHFSEGNLVFRDYSLNDNSGIFKGNLNDGSINGIIIGNFEDNLDGFSRCNSGTITSYVTGKFGKGLEVWSTSSDTIGCMAKYVGDLPAGYSLFFYGKGFVSLYFYDTSVASYVQDVETGCRTSDGDRNIFQACNGGNPYPDWRLFKIVAFRASTGAGLYLWSKQVGNLESYAGYYDYITSSPIWTDGKYGKDLYFDGNDDYVVVPYHNSLDITDKITLEAWINFNPIGTSKRYGIISRSYDTYELALSNYGGSEGLTLDFYKGDPSGGADNLDGFHLNNLDSILLPNVWYHVATTWDGVNAKFYINGVQYNPTSTEDGGNGISPSIRTSTNPLMIGKRSEAGGSMYFNGMIDESRIYNHALTETEIKYSMLSAYPLTRTVAYYKFEDNTKDIHNIQQGKQGLAINFNGINDYIINSTPVFNPTTFTISFWINPTSTADWTRIISKDKRQTSPYEGWMVLYENSAPQKIYLAMFNTAGGESGSYTNKILAPLNSWTQVTYTFDGTIIRTYKNGTLVGTDAFSGTYKPSSQPLIIGAGDSDGISSYFNGMIDEFEIYPYVKNPEEIAVDFNGDQNVAPGTNIEVSVDLKNTGNPQDAWTAGVEFWKVPNHTIDMSGKYTRINRVDTWYNYSTTVTDIHNGSWDNDANASLTGAGCDLVSETGSTPGTFETNEIITVKCYVPSSHYGETNSSERIMFWIHERDRTEDVGNNGNAGNDWWDDALVQSTPQDPYNMFQASENSIRATIKPKDSLVFSECPSCQGCKIKDLILDGSTDYLNVRWYTLRYPSNSTDDIAVNCYLNCLEPSGSPRTNCASSQTCNYRGPTGIGTCTIPSPIYSLREVNNVTCEFYEPLTGYIYSPYIRETFKPIEFSTILSPVNTIVGKPYTFPIGVRNTGILTSNYTVNMSALSPNAMIDNSFSTTEPLPCNQRGQVYPIINFLTTGSYNFQVLSKPNITSFESSCTSDSDCIHYGDALCILNRCWKKDMVTINAGLSSLPEFGIFGVIQIIVLAAVGFMLILIKRK